MFVTTIKNNLTHTWQSSSLSFQIHQVTSAKFNSFNQTSTDERNYGVNIKRPSWNVFLKILFQSLIYNINNFLKCHQDSLVVATVTQFSPISSQRLTTLQIIPNYQWSCLPRVHTKIIQWGMGRKYYNYVIILSRDKT